MTVSDRRLAWWFVGFFAIGVGCLGCVNSSEPGPRSPIVSGDSPEAQRAAFNAQKIRQADLDAERKLLGDKKREQ